MRSTGIFLLFLALASAAPSADVLAAAVSCEGGIISTGDRSIDVLAKCGPPDSKESHQEELSERLNDNTKQKAFVTVEEWTYNFGPTKFMRIIVLKNGVVANIRLGNYGYDRQTEPVQHECSEQLVSVGYSKTDVLAKCGEPTLKDSHVEETSEKLGKVSICGRRCRFIIAIWNSYSKSETARKPRMMTPASTRSQ